MDDPKCVAIAYDGNAYILQLRYGDGEWDMILQDRQKGYVMMKAKDIALFSGQPLMDYTVHGSPVVPLDDE